MSKTVSVVPYVVGDLYSCTFNYNPAIGGPKEGDSLYAEHIVTIGLKGDGVACYVTSKQTRSGHLVYVRPE